MARQLLAAAFLVAASACSRAPASAPGAADADAGAGAQDTGAPDAATGSDSDAAAGATTPIVCGLDAGLGGPAPDAGSGPATPRPFFPPSGANLAKADALLTGFSEADWLALVPRQSLRSTTPCPVA